MIIHVQNWMFIQLNQGKPTKLISVSHIR